MRTKALKNFDQVLSWSVSEKLRSVALSTPFEEKFENIFPETKLFVQHFGYFSSARPIIARVSTDPEDTQHICCLLKAFSKKKKGDHYVQLATAEILAKGLAYRDLKEGQSVSIPVVINRKIFLEKFQVTLFDLWLGMPAFGLIPEREGVESILLFRGTDFSLTSERGWASLMSDVDTAGPGLSVFRKAQPKLHDWLSAMKAKGHPAKVIGFSLGGALAAYTFIYENSLLTNHGSIAFCPPGVAEEVIADWEKLPIERRQGLHIYINPGDVVSKVGKLFGEVYALSGTKPLKPLDAHTHLMTFEKLFTRTKVDVAKENAER